MIKIDGIIKQEKKNNRSKNVLKTERRFFLQVQWDNLKLINYFVIVKRTHPLLARGASQNSKKAN